MPVTVHQRWEGSELSQASDAASIKSEYVIRGTDDEFEAYDELDTATADTAGGLIKKSVRINERLSDDVWAGEVEWGKMEQPETDDSSFSFDTGGGTSQIQHSLLTRSSTSPLRDGAPDFKGAINVTSGAVEGCQITIPQYNFQETHYVAASAVTAAYKATIFSLTGSVNNATYKGFSVGEVLFLGASGSLRQHDQYELTFKFAASPSATDIPIGDLITVPLKRGWDYLWVWYREGEDGEANQMIRTPLAAYVEQVYEEKNLTLLGI